MKETMCTHRHFTDVFYFVILKGYLKVAIEHIFPLFAAELNQN